MVGKEDSAGSSLSTWEDSGSKEHLARLGPKLCIPEQGHVPSPPQGCVLFQAASLPVDVVTALVTLMAQWLSGNQVCAPGRADKGRVLVLQCGACGNPSWAGGRARPGPGQRQPHQRGIKWQGVLQTGL